MSFNLLFSFISNVIQLSRPAAGAETPDSLNDARVKRIQFSPSQDGAGSPDLLAVCDDHPRAGLRLGGV